MDKKILQKECDILILGGGPAGLSAALYAARGGAKTLLIEKFVAGGQANQTPNIANYPGILSISGTELADTMRAQAVKYGTEIMYGEPERIHLTKSPKSIFVEETKILAKIVILATGANSRKLGLAREAELVGMGISYCATCDGAFFRKKAVAVVGGGNTAVTDALYLKDICHEVTLIHRREVFRASPELISKLRESGIKLILNSIITKLAGEPLAALSIQNVVTGEESQLAVNGLFIAAGRLPDTAAFPLEILNPDGFVMTDSAMRTKLENVLAAGDVREKPLRQIVTAAADGAIAAETALGILRKN